MMDGGRSAISDIRNPVSVAPLWRVHQTVAVLRHG